jgi:multiple sugar transport system permease protein/raffinose/stachyose/melibiose transport system permease protein
MKRRFLRVKHIWAYPVLMGALYFSLFPFLWMVTSAIKPDIELFTTMGSIIPRHISFHNFEFVWSYTPFATYLRNSLKVAVLTVIIGGIVAIPGGYALARFKFPGSKIYGTFLLMTQMFPGVLLVIPLFIILQILHFSNTHISIILIYSATTLPFCVWMMRSFFETIPIEIEEAAIVDGCSRLEALFRVILPISSPGIATIFVYTFLVAWNEFLFGFVFLQKQNLFTLSIGMAAFMDEQGVQWGWLMAAATLTTVPVFILFILMQRFIVKGLVMGAVKG